MTIMEIFTVDGCAVDVEVPDESPTVQQVCDAMVEHHGFRPQVRLMSGGKILDGKRRCDEFASGSLIAVGVRAPAKKPSPIPEALSEDPTTQPSTTNGIPKATRSSSISPTSRRKPPAPGDISVTVLVPSTERRHLVHLHPHATVSDLVTHVLARDPTLHATRFVFHGHELSDMAAELRHYGVGNGAVVHVASRAMDPTEARFAEVQAALNEMKKIVAQGETTLDQRKGYFEKAMRLLFSLDDLADLEGERRMARKALVHDLHAFQDSLGVNMSPH